MKLQTIEIASIKMIPVKFVSMQKRFCKDSLCRCSQTAK